MLNGTDGGISEKDLYYVNLILKFADIPFEQLLQTVIEPFGPTTEPGNASRTKIPKLSLEWRGKIGISRSAQCKNGQKSGRLKRAKHSKITLIDRKEQMPFSYNGLDNTNTFQNFTFTDCDVKSDVGSSNANNSKAISNNLPTFRK